MVRHYYERYLFKSIYWQCGLALCFLLSVVAIHYVSFVKEDQAWLKRQALENQKLEQALQAEKKQQGTSKQVQSKLYLYKEAEHYLVPPKMGLAQAGLGDPFAIYYLTELATKENLNVKHIALQGEKVEGSRISSLVHLGLLGSYRAFIKFYFSLMQHPYLIQTMQFKFERISQEKEYGGDSLYADLLIHVHVFK